jgi:hypothetical protein
MGMIPKDFTDMCGELNHILPPNPPDPTMCCNRGCVPCVYDYYRDNLKTWKTSIDQKINESNLSSEIKQKYLDIASTYLQKATT